MARSSMNLAGKLDIYTGMVMFTGSPSASFVTGEVQRVDSGQSTH